MFENASGKFLTYAEARQKQWKCEKCGDMFAERSYEGFPFLLA